MQKKIVGKIRRMKTRPMSQKEGYTFYVNDSISFRVLKSFIDPSGITVANLNLDVFLEAAGCRLFSIMSQ